VNALLTVFDASKGFRNFDITAGEVTVTEDKYTVRTQTHPNFMDVKT
jgi:hypothetical protein